ncbi:SDR family oxidoreductase [uncultured Parasphingorhabdus sp.]|uniref:SDR family oxidoreductase n=1 Tax=uncultured Parasphingorhabdus sp. TaxID=2709694 RepID=UPI0030DD523B
MSISSDRVAIITGASRGIGASIAHRLASDGMAVVVNYAGSEKAAAELVDEIVNAGGRAISAQADVADPLAVRNLFDTAEAEFGGVDVLVNNAGIMKLAPVAQVDDTDFDEMMAVNLKGTFNGLREAAKRLRDGGRIVNISTSVVGLYLPAYGVYAATKAAVEALTHILAKELGPRSITVNSVAPGPVATELFLEGKDPAMIERLEQMIPLGRLGEVDDIARAVSVLVGPDGGWINGQIVRVNGGVI